MQDPTDRLIRQIIAEVPEQRRREKLEAISKEGELHTLLRDVMLGMGYQWAEITHGSFEQGKDLVGALVSITGAPEFHAYVVKLGKLSGRAGAHDNVMTVQQQVATAFKVPFSHPRVKGSVPISKVVVVCTGAISEQAKAQINSGEIRNVDFWTLFDLEERVTRFHPGFYIRETPAVIDFYARLDEYCEDLGDVLGRNGFRSLKRLRDVYVEPRLIQPPTPTDLRMRGRKLPKSGKKALVPTIQPARIHDTKLLVDPPGNLFLIGDPGTGKTRAMRRAVTKLIAARLRGDTEAPTPLWCDAPTLLKVLNAPTAGAAIGAAQPIKSMLDGLEVDDILQREQAILYVDRFDEIPNTVSRGRILHFLRELSKQCPRLRIVCGSRPIKYWQVDTIDGFGQAWMLPMSTQAMQDLLTKLLGEKARAVSILHGLAERRVAGLPTTPLILTLLAILHEQQVIAEIPASAAELYRMFSEVCLGKWSVEPGVDAPYTYAVLSAIVSEFACVLHEAGREVASFQELEDTCRRYMDDRGIGGDPREVAKRLVERSGLISCTTVPSTSGDTDEPDESGVTFFHQSFQEFFVALRMSQRHDPPDKLLDRFLNPWWTNVCFFYAGLLKDAPDVIRHVVQSNVPDPSFSLFKSLNLGYLVQAAHQSPRQVKMEAALEGASLAQDFYNLAADQVSEGKSPLPWGRFELLVSLAWMYAFAYSSAYMTDALERAFDTLWDRYTAIAADPARTVEVQRLGLMCFGMAIGAAERGKYDRLDRFCDGVSVHDPALVQASLFLLNDDTGALGLLVTRDGAKHEMARAERYQRNLLVLKRRSKKIREILQGGPIRARVLPAPEGAPADKSKPKETASTSGPTSGDMPVLAPEQEYDGSVYVPRIIWALEYTERHALGAPNAAEIANIITEQAGVPVHGTNIARFLRSAQATAKPLWDVTRDGRSARYRLNAKGRLVAAELWGLAPEPEPTA